MVTALPSTPPGVSATGKLKGKKNQIFSNATCFAQLSHCFKASKSAKCSEIILSHCRGDENISTLFYLSGPGSL